MVDPVLCEQLRNETRPQWRDEWRSPKERPIAAAYQVVQYSILLTITSVGLLLFAYYKLFSPRRRELSHLEPRPLIAVAVTHGAFILALHTGSWFDAHEFEDGPSCVLLAFVHFVVPGLALPIGIRLIGFYREAVVAKMVMRVKPSQMGGARASKMNAPSQIGAANESAGPDMSDATSSHPWASGHGVLFWARSLCRVMLFVTPSSARSASVSSPRTTTKTTGSQLSAAPPRTDDASSVGASQSTFTGVRLNFEEIRVWRFLASSSGTLVTLAVFFSPYVVFAIVSGLNSTLIRAGCFGCFNDAVGNVMLTLGAVMAIVVLVASTLAVRTLPDPLGVVAEVKLIVFCGGTPAFIFFICDQFTSVRSLGEWNFNIGTEIFLAVYCAGQSYVQIYQAHKIATARAAALEIERNTADFFQAKALPPGSKLHDAFEAHLVAEHSPENLRFHDEVWKWQNGFGEMGPNTARSRAKKITAIFIGDATALFPINISAGATQSVLQAVADSNREVEPSLFDRAVIEVRDLMWRDAWQRFVLTAEFDAAWKELP